MVKIERKKIRPNTLVSAASVRWRTLAEKVYCAQLSVVNRKTIERKHRKSRSSHITYRSRKFDLICILAVALFPVLVTLLIY